MRAYTAVLSWMGGVILLFAVGGCSFGNEFPLSAQCASDSDCTGKNVCTLGVCQPREANVGSYKDVDNIQDTHDPGDTRLRDASFNDVLETTDSSGDAHIPDIQEVLDSEGKDTEVSLDVDESLDVDDRPKCDDGVIQQCQDSHGVCQSMYRICEGGEWGECAGISRAGIQAWGTNNQPNENVKILDLGLIEHVDCVAPAEAGMTYISAGVFYRGASGNNSNEDERPRTEIYLTPYFIDTYEVSRRDYKRCMDESGCQYPVMHDLNCVWQEDDLSDDHIDRPITCVDFQKARTYCEKQGKRLATEAEWEKAARGPIKNNERPGRSFPWGNDWKSEGRRYANMLDETRPGGGCRVEGSRLVNDRYCLEKVNAPERDSGKSYYGVHHMAGNVAEHVRDIYNPDYYVDSPNVNPVSLSSGGGPMIPVVRGGSFSEGRDEGRVVYRSISGGVIGTPAHQIGIRCVKNAP